MGLHNRKLQKRCWVM